MESPAKNPVALADDLSRCEKVTLKFDNENHTLSPTEIGWLIDSLVSQNSASIDVGKWDTITDIATETWNYIEFILVEECGLTVEGDWYRPNCINAIKNALVSAAPPPDGLLHGKYPLPVEHYEREARNLAAVWTNGNDGARTCILAALLKAAAPVPSDEPLAALIQEYARDLRRNSSGGDDYPWEWAKAAANYLETLIDRSVSFSQAGE
jgi:hypothetical protein